MSFFDWFSWPKPAPTVHQNTLETLRELRRNPFPTYTVTYQPRAQRCPVCEGRAGKMERDGFVDCRACDGKGIVWPPQRTEAAS